MIPFNEKGMRTFKDVRSAVKYFTENGKIPQKRIVALFQSTFQIVSGKYSVNVLELQKSGDLKMFLMKTFKVKNAQSFERTNRVFEMEIEKWNNKFKVPVIKQEVTEVIE